MYRIAKYGIEKEVFPAGRTQPGGSNPDEN
jgi:hypothetical protein